MSQRKHVRIPDASPGQMTPSILRIKSRHNVQLHMRVVGWPGFFFLGWIVLTSSSLVWCGSLTGRGGPAALRRGLPAPDVVEGLPGPDAAAVRHRRAAGGHPLRAVTGAVHRRPGAAGHVYQLQQTGAPLARTEWGIWGIWGDAVHLDICPS